MNYEQAKQKLKGLIAYYDSLARIAERTGGSRGSLRRYYALRDDSRYSVIDNVRRLSHRGMSDGEIIRQFTEKALRIFQY